MDRLRALSEQLDLARSVIFVGGVSDSELVREYQAADAFIIPSVALEGFGLVALEALACGTPVIASDLGGLGEFARVSAGCTTVAAGDVDALGAAITVQRRPSLSERERNRATAMQFTWARTASQCLRVYESVSRDGMFADYD